VLNSSLLELVLEVSKSEEEEEEEGILKMSKSIQGKITDQEKEGRGQGWKTHSWV